MLGPLSSLPNTHITIGVRSLSKYSHLHSHNTDLVAMDTSTPSEPFARSLAEYDIVISCTGFGQPLGTVTKLAENILEAGRIRARKGQSKLWFFPWQWGVDYDTTRDAGGLMPLFGEQLSVRTLLRSAAAASNVAWTIVSVGMFMSFLFEDAWGVVVRRDSGFVVRGLGGMGRRVTVTAVEDVGRVVGRIVGGEVKGCEDAVVFVAGDTLSYGEVAGVIERVTGREVGREEWGVERLRGKVEAGGELERYRCVFAGEGVAWGVEGTVNERLGMEMMGVEAYVRKRF